MRFMVMVRSTKAIEATPSSPDPEMMAAMGRYNQELLEAGVLLDVHGLYPSSKGAARVRFSGTKRTVIDGPFTETKELVAGYWLFQTSSLEECIEWVKRCPGCDPTGADSEIEIRQLWETSELPDVPPEIRAKEEALAKNYK